MNERYERAATLLRDAISERIFPGAVAEVGSRSGIEWRMCAGHLSFDADAAATSPQTVYDLASLTKPLATTSVAMNLVARERLRLDDRVSQFCADWTASDRTHVTIRQLLEHASGLPARLQMSPPPSLAAFLRAICDSPLDRAPGTGAIYSDLGFILLGSCLEHAAGQALSHQSIELLSEVLSDAGAGSERCFLASVPTDVRPRTAPTSPLPEDEYRHRRLQGDVHDNYAAALGGFAGHAGLFGTASAVGVIARTVLDAARGAEHRVPFTRALVAQMLTPSRVPGSSRALGWDTMRPTSSCGRFLSASSVGHVGFTGTSVWIDPERDRYFVLLTNRVCEGGSSDDMQRVRRAFHEALTAP